MAITFCTNCQREVYMLGNEEDACPVCSSPVVETEQDIRRRTAPSAL